MPPVLSRLCRVLKVGAIAGIAIGVIRALRGRGRNDVTGEARWQPLGDTAPEPVVDTAPQPVVDTAPQPPAEPAQPDVDTSWVEPVDGACPASHPVKANADSGIFHVVGGASYERTTPERCYASAAAAEADGFRRAKR